MRLLLSVLALSWVLLLAQSAPSNIGDKRIVCYYGSWAVYRYGPAQITPELIEPGLCTHFIYTFVGLDESTASVKLLDPWNDIGEGTWKIGQISVLREKARAAGTKFGIALGGWNEGSESYSRVIGNPNTRQTLINSIVSFVDRFDLDGFDLDWEYPAQRGGVPSDKAAYSAFVGSLYQILKAKGKFLSAAVTANALTIDGSYDVPYICQNIDMINVMAYDLHGSWESVTGHHTPLYARQSDYPDNAHLNVVSAVKGWLDAGCNPSILNLGTAAYGRSFTLASTAVTGIGAPALSTAPAGWSGEAGFFGYDQICASNSSGWTTVWDQTQQVPYTYKGNTWIGYDDEASLRLKVCLAKSVNFGGVMLWTVETDDFRGNCGNGRYPLLRALSSSLADPSCGGPLPEVPTLPPPVATPPPATQAPTTQAPTTQAPTTQAPTTQAPTTQAPTTQPSATEGPTTQVPTWTTTLSPEVEEEYATNPTPAEPIAPPPSGSVVTCNAVGAFIRDPNDCSSFYTCAPGPAGTIIPIKRSCSPGLQYDSTISTCNYRAVVRCVQ